jgi:hypothetical protein
LIPQGSYTRTEPQRASFSPCRQLSGWLVAYVLEKNERLAVTSRQRRWRGDYRSDFTTFIFLYEIVSARNLVSRTLLPMNALEQTHTGASRITLKSYEWSRGT